MRAVQDKLDEVVRLVEQARAMPMSSSVVLHRGDLLDLLEELRALLPQAITEARQVVADRDAVVEQGRQEALRLVEQGRREHERLVSATEVHRSACREAERLVAEAEQTAATMQVRADDYVDTKLANFEIVLHKTLVAVERGRDKLAGRSALDALAGPEVDPALPEAAPRQGSAAPPVR